MADALVGLLRRAGLTIDNAHVRAAKARDAVLDDVPDIAVLDFAEGPPSALDILRDVRGASSPTRVILFVGLEGLEPIDAVELGVDGLLPRDAPVAAVSECIERVASGEQWLDQRAMRVAHDRLTQRHSPAAGLLTPRERDVARLVATGQRNRGIATALGISEGTVKMHLHNVYAKMGLESRTQLAMDTRLASMR
ncbi:response regulator transcription factor [Glacieibacterium frigidum]|uniref:Response regulator transcription factor n=1 Tax=Glacieibacterium frigidum TaxID=2593303 RepID=A0A552UI77_9SPHN|nr:response regulator transcription factor [Glacieibacterium frigidum]TRW17922.1 response regulator transcription factor [Glacieibacterium frigidum]